MEIIERRKILMYCRNSTFIYYDELNNHMKVEWATLEYVFDYFFDVRVEKFYSEKERYLYNLFEKWDLESFELVEDFNDYLKNDGLENIVGEAGIYWQLVLSALSTLKSCSTSMPYLIKSVIYYSHVKYQYVHSRH